MSGAVAHKCARCTNGPIAGIVQLFQVAAHLESRHIPVSSVRVQRFEYDAPESSRDPGGEITHRDELGVADSLIIVGFAQFYELVAQHTQPDEHPEQGHPCLKNIGLSINASVLDD